MKRKKLISVFIAVLIIGTAFVLPLSANALQSSTSTTLTTTWERGCYYATTGTKYGETLSYFIRTADFIDVSSYDNISINFPNGYEYNIHYYDSDHNFISSTNPQTGYSSNKGTIEILGEYITVSVYKNPVEVSEGSNITLKGNITIDPALIDTSEKGTLRIHKYEMEDVSQADEEGTGYSTDSSNLPEQAKPLQGVSFSIKRVVAIDSTGIYYYNSSGTKVTTTIYSSQGTTLPTVEEAQSYKNIDDNGNIDNTNRSPIATNSSGLAQFSNLPLGVYLVHEESTPSQVVGAVADFVVSLPMTNIEGTQWKYDVDVYPKNETRYQDITLEKTDFDTGEGIENATFKIERTNDNGESWYSIETGLVTDEYGTLSPPNPLPVKGTYRFVETSAADGYILDDSNKSYSFYINEDGKVCDTTNSHNIIDESNPYRIQMTNSKPTIEKFIDKSKGNNDNLVKSSAKLGDYDYFSIKIHTPNINMNSMRTFKVTDTVMGQSGAGTPVISKILKEDGTELSTDSYTRTYTPTYSSSGPYYLTVDITPSSLAKNTDYYIIVRTNVGKRNATNTAKLIYSTNTVGTETTDEIESDEVYLYYFGYKLKKIDGTTTNPLRGAEFKLYKSREDADTNQNAIQTVTSDNNGLVEFSFINVGDKAEDSANLTDDLVWEQGAINDSTGATGDSTTSIRTTSFSVENFSKLSYTGEALLHKFYFYDENGDFVSCISGNDDTTNIINVPTGAHTAKMTFYQAEGLIPDDSSNLTALTGTSMLEGTYYVVETKAPTYTFTNTQGNQETIEYSLLSEPFEIKVNNNSVNVSAQDMTYVKNYKKIEFPMTGGYGIILLLTVGVLCLIFAGIVHTKRKQVRALM